MQFKEVCHYKDYDNSFCNTVTSLLMSVLHSLLSGRNSECPLEWFLICVCVCIIYSYNNEGTIGYKNSNTNIIKNKNGLTD